MGLINANVIISGWNGKMGQKVRTLAPSYFSGKCWNGTQLENEEIKKLKPCVWIDFSHASLINSVIAWTQKIQCPLISGTTNLSQEQLQQLEKLSHQVPVIYDTNFSVGIHLLRILIKKLPPLSDFDISILESHHITKQDRPSGTAKTLLKDLQATQGADKPIEVLSHRGGGIRGEHHVFLSGKNEILSLKHEALDRSIFAEGALKAAVWSLQKSFGLFSMEDVLI